MNMNARENLVYTIKDKCRVCYTCVRECPVKAIKIINGQAEVIGDRCIACGNCTKVCSQGAKIFKSTISEVEDLLTSELPVYALIAPSFVAEFSGMENWESLIGMIRELGFNKVFEVSFGADLVAEEYRKLLQKEDKRGYISSDCPAIVAFIEKYHPGIIENLAPIVSPMVAMARYLRKVNGSRFSMVFIGPCIAKKNESAEVDAKITFVELREMFDKHGICPSPEIASDFDPPVGARGALFPVSRGLLETVNIREGDLKYNVIVAGGRVDFQEAIREYESGSIESEHLELLCCEGCIMGPGTSRNGKKHGRRAKVTGYVRDKLKNFDQAAWEKAMETGRQVNLGRKFHSEDQRIADPSEADIREVLHSMNKFTPDDHLNCGACGYDTCRNHAIAIKKGLAETEMCLPYTIDKLHHSIEELGISNEKLMSVQQVLKQTEKLAHMGQLSAGIAHELNNPLGVVIMYSNILLEEYDENAPLYEDLKLIVEQAERCKVIVGGLLNFARKNQVNYSENDLSDLVRLSVSSVIIPPGINVYVINRLKNPVAETDREQMVQVISNLIKNAVEAMPGKGEIHITLGESGKDVSISIRDTGTGISENDLQKVFEPFFTTKGIGKGTGLGLATAYGVVKMHRGKISVTSNADPASGPTFTQFFIRLPRHRPIVI